MRNVIFFIFSTIMSSGLGLGLEDTGLDLILEENWPWPRRELALALASKRTGLGLRLEHALLEPIPGKSIMDNRCVKGQLLIGGDLKEIYTLIYSPSSQPLLTKLI